MSGNIQEISSLKELGLTENQAKVIIGMVKIGSQSDASNIAKVSSVPGSKIYFILQQLTEMGLVEIFPVEGGANYYSCLSTDSIILKLKEISDQRINKIVSSLNIAEKGLKSLEKTKKIDSMDKLDFLVMKGKERIVKQINDSLEKIAQNNTEIIMTLPISISKDLSKAIFQKLVIIRKNMSGPLKVKILINSQEYSELQALVDISSLLDNFLVVDFDLLKKMFEEQKTGGTNPMPLVLIDKFDLFFTSRPIFIVAGNEAAFIVIGENNMISSVKIQLTEFVMFQQRFLSSLFDLIQTFVKGTNLHK